MKASLIFWLVFAVGDLALAGDTEALFLETIEAYRDAHELGHQADTYIYARRAYRLGQPLYEGQPENLGLLAHIYGQAAAAFREREAQSLLHEAVDQYQIAFGEESPRLIPLYNDLGDEALSRRNKAAAYAAYKAALKMATREAPDGSLAEGIARLGIGVLYQLGGRQARSLEYVHAGATLIERHAPIHDWRRRAHAQFTVGEVEQFWGQAGFALNRYEKALATYLANAPQDWRILTLRKRIIASAHALADHDTAAYHCTEIARSRPHLQGSIVYDPRRITDWRNTRGRKVHISYNATIDAGGRPRNIRIHHTSGVEEKRARTLIAGSYFAPMLKNGHPAPFDTEVVNLIVYLPR